MAISRRNFLKGLGAATATVPLMPSLATAQASFPKRIVFLYSPNGTVPDRWVPSGDENNWQLSEILQPLQPHKDDLIVIEGVDMRVTSRGPGAAHQRGIGAVLTGRPLNDGNFQGGGNTVSGWASGISVDQFIANERDDGTKFRSLQLGVRATGGENRQTMTYSGSDQPILPDNDPYNVFDRVFAEFNQDPFGLEQTRIQRRSVLDFVLEDLNRIQANLSSHDRQRLDAHLESVRRIEERLQNTDGTTTCEAPVIGDRINPTAMDNFPTIGKLQMDLLVNALACDLTRVATLQFSRATSSMRFSWLGFDDRHHGLSHEGDGNQSAQDKLVEINKWHAEQFGYLLDQMKSIPEGDGTLLDNSVVVWMNSLGKGNSHTRNDIPIVMAGSCGGVFDTGRFLEYGDDTHNNLLVTLCKAMDVDVDEFGDPDFCTGELTGLT